MQQKSVFVEIVGWVFVVLAGFGVLAGILQNILVFTFFPADLTPHLPPEQQDMPGGWMLDYFRVFSVLFLALMVAVLVAAANLLRRRNWARQAFIGLMILGVFWNIAGLVLQWWVMADVMPRHPQHPEITQQLETMWKLTAWAGAVMALALSGLFAWIAWKLTRPAIRAEFA